jgi:hypothetical protein
VGRTYPLETTEQGEDAAKKAYKEALKGEIPSASIRYLLLKQQIWRHTIRSKPSVTALPHRVRTIYASHGEFVLARFYLYGKRARR